LLSDKQFTTILGTSGTCKAWYTVEYKLIRRTNKAPGATPTTTTL